MAENPNLPDEILIEIFSRLPTKAAGRCRCLSKTWISQLTTPQFAHLHLSRRRNAAIEKLFLISGEDGSLRTIDAPIGDGATSRKLDLGLSCDSVLGSCNGLVLLPNVKETETELKQELFLVNPTTLQHFKLPDLPLAVDPIFRYHRFGFGYDSLNNDYKVVVLSNNCDGAKFIYSLKSGGTWKRFVSDHLTRVFHNGAFVNGAIHWNDGPFKIWAFDLAADVFRELPRVPSTREHLDFSMVLAIQGCLGIAHSYNWDKGEADIWMMKEYGIGASWTRFTIDTNREHRIHRPLCPSCVLGDRELLLVTYTESVTTEDMILVVYNLKEGTTKAMVVDGVPALWFPGVIFVDSLVSPNYQYSN